MRRQATKPKRHESVVIPSELVAFFVDVHRQIEESDEGTLIESDDLLQTDFAYGGRDGDDQFSFTYFPERGIRQKWQLSLSPDEIARIARGESETLKLWACTQPDCRSKFGTADGPQCFYCDWEDQPGDV
jgi:hypothetical protein